MNDPVLPGPSRRGRPPKSLKRQVVRQVMDAAEAALMEKTGREVRIRDIAEAAGVDATIINYYFGGKDGLMVAMLHEIMRQAPYARYEVISDECIKTASIKPLVRAFAQFYYARPGLIRMTMVELMSNSSEVKSAYRSRYYDATPEFVERVIRSLMDLSIYNRHFDARYLALSILRMLLAPLTGSSSKYALGDEAARSDWIDFISDIVDMALKSPAPN